MRNRYRKNNIARQRSGRRLWILIKKKFFKEPVEELTIDEYDVPFASEAKKWIVKYVPNESGKTQDEVKAMYSPFKEVDEDARFERHMKPIRELQEQNDKVFKPKRKL